MPGKSPSNTGFEDSSERRRLASPIDGLDQVHITSLQQLPGEILNLIVEFVHQSDLKSFCLISKLFCWPALKRLYRNITIIHQWYFTDCEVQKQIPNNLTVIFLRNREKFLATVSKNGHIAALVESLTIANLPGTKDIPDVVHISELGSYSLELLSHLRLKTFHCLEHFDSPIPQQAIQTVQRTVCCMDRVFPLSSNLVELRIVCDTLSFTSREFQELALGMIEQGFYRKLKKLAFEILNFSDHTEQTEFLEVVVARGRPTWAQFFATLSKKGVKLNLSALSIYGEFRDDSNDPTADIVGQAVQLSELETLNIKFENYIKTHELQPQEYGSHTFLAAITRKTPSLQCLSIIHSEICSEADVNALARILRDIIPNQLKQLRLAFAQEIDQTVVWKAEFLSRTIVTYQRNLVKLKLESSGFWGARCIRVLLNVPHLRCLEFSIMNVESTRDILEPSIIGVGDFTPFIDEELFSGILSHKSAISHFLDSDLIYSSAPTYLPFLTEYYVMGLHVNIKERGIFANERMIRLEE